MGWKASCIFVSSSGLDVFSHGVHLEHSQDKAENIRSDLGLAGYLFDSNTTLDISLYPKNNDLAIGAYAGASIICNSVIPAFLFDDKSRNLIVGKQKNAEIFCDALFGHNPKGEVLCIMLHSVVNLWAYCHYIDGHRTRLVAGSSDNGLIVNEGVVLPEENVILSEHSMQSVIDKGLGEDLVMEVTRRVLGKRLDEFSEMDLQMTNYKKEKRSFLSRIFGR